MIRRLFDQLFLRIGIIPPRTARRMQQLSEWLGSGLGVLGSLLMAANVEASPFSWLFFLASSALLLVFAALTRSTGLAVMQMTFIGTSILGIGRWLA